jgi:hypothetical protein
MMQSVSMLIIGSGAATEVSFLNFCMPLPLRRAASRHRRAPF